MRIEEESPRGFTAKFLARRVPSSSPREAIESEFNRRNESKVLRYAFSQDRGNGDVVFKKYANEELRKFHALYGSYLLEDEEFDSNGDLTLKFEWNERVEALLANIGIEYRTEKKRHYYIGTSLHRPWDEIGKIYPEYDDNLNAFNDDKEFFLEMLGNFITIDFRYFFPE